MAGAPTQAPASAPVEPAPARSPSINLNSLHAGQSPDDEQPRARLLQGQALGIGFEPDEPQARPTCPRFLLEG